MTANITLLILIAVLIACGVYLVLERAVSKMLLGLLLFGNAVNLLIITLGGADGRPPILGESDRLHRDTADPLAQAMVLTSIVITMGLAAFVLALAYRAYVLTLTEQVENDPEDVKVASRREGEDPEQ
ncbi:Na(+)/H(+) antiporter subunit C [Nocardia sp. CDC159]|uniref:Na(+)/H(+) antiporter subunit C n=1 Tax=Nocardia pulmonis TaxID=2951408 RepID=A0A9X2EFQ4_9NOCA|nr:MULTISPECIES: Na(+)/H(+) antiporter subunit C [Nocardia]MCM6777406.1 Na(+)/H(+) antiporter subunit C [Nocardia pulmonis]MCM6790291.1 Na(+)/H(+) antiporter subunit C [Nocardia sp. CDC159]